MNSSIKMFLLFCITTFTYATGTNNDLLMTQETLLSADGMTITDEELELVYNDVEKAFVEAGHHEAAASVRAEWEEVAESISRRRLGLGYRTPTVRRGVLKRSHAKNWDVDGGATGFCRNNKGERYAACLGAFATVTTRLNNIDTFTKAQGGDVCYQPAHISRNEDNAGDCTKIGKVKCDSSSWDLHRHDDTCVVDVERKCASVNWSKILVWGQAAINIVCMLFTGGTSAVAKGATSMTTMMIAKQAAKNSMTRLFGGKLSTGVGLKMMQSAPNSIRANCMASIKIAAKHASKGGNKAWYNFNKNMKDHFLDGGVTQALKEKLAEEIIWMDLIGSPMVLSSIVNDKDVIGKAAWELAAVVDPTGISAVLKYYKDRRDSVCVFDDPPKLSEKDINDVMAFAGAVDVYEAVDENSTCSTIANNADLTNAAKGLFNEELGRRFDSPQACAQSKAMAKKCSSGVFQHNRETQECKCCDGTSVKADPNKKWNTYKMATYVCPTGYLLAFPGSPKGECQQHTTNDGESKVTAPSREACAEKCTAAGDNCYAFDFHPDSKACYLNQKCDKQYEDEYLSCRKNKCPEGWEPTFGKSEDGECNHDDGSETNGGKGNTPDQCAEKCAANVKCIAFDIDHRGACWLNSKCPKQDVGDGYLSCTRKIPEFCPDGYERRRGYSTKIIGNEHAHDALKRKAAQPYTPNTQPYSYTRNNQKKKPILDADVLRIPDYDDLPSGHTALNVDDCAKKCNQNGYKGQGWTLLRTSSECGKNTPEKKLGTFDSLEQCAEACRKRSGCTNFLYGKGSRRGECYDDGYTEEACPNFISHSGFDFYAIGKKCNAFEYSESSRYCYMFADPEPESSSPELDFMFCAKPMDVTKRLETLGYEKVGNGLCLNDKGEKPYAYYSDLLSMSECINFCEEETYCTGIAMTIKSHSNPNRCYMYGEQKAFDGKSNAFSWNKQRGKGFVMKSAGGSSTAQCYRNLDYKGAYSEVCRDKQAIAASTGKWWYQCRSDNHMYTCGNSCCCKEGYQMVGDASYCSACSYSTVTKSAAKKPRDNDQCVSKDYEGYKCDSSYCRGYAKTYSRCCPETCGIGVYTQSMCKNTNSDGICRYPNNAQLPNSANSRKRHNYGMGTTYGWRPVKRKYECGDQSNENFLKTTNSAKECARACYDSPNCASFVYGSSNKKCYDEGIAGAHECADGKWKYTTSYDFYQFYEGCQDMVPIYSHQKWYWGCDNCGNSDSWKRKGDNSYKCGDYYCCNKGYEPNWEGICVATEACGATCTFKLLDRDYEIDGDKVHKTSINDLDTCAEECMKDSKCFGFDFGKKDSNNKCLHSTRNTKRCKYNKNYDSWLKVCYHESGNPGYFELRSAAAESVISNGSLFTPSKLIRFLAFVGVVFIACFAYKTCKKKSEYVDIPSKVKPEEI